MIQKIKGKCNVGGLNFFTGSILTLRPNSKRKLPSIGLIWTYKMTE